jgi:hypothetical protein
VAQRLTTGLHARGFRIPLHLLVHSRDRKWPMRAFLIPEDRRTDRVCGAEGQAGSQRRHGIRRGVDPPIFPAFALYDVNGLLRPVDIVHCEVDHLGNPQTTPEHEPEEGLIHRVVDLRQELLDLVLREGCGQGPPLASHVTRFDRIPRDVPLCEEVVEDLCQGVQASMKGGRGSPVCRRLVHTPLDVLKRNVGGRPWTDRKAPRQIQGIVCDSVSRILAALEILLETVDGLANRVVHGPFS